MLGLTELPRWLADLSQLKLFSAFHRRPCSHFSINRQPIFLILLTTGWLTCLETVGLESVSSGVCRVGKAIETVFDSVKNLPTEIVVTTTIYFSVFNSIIFFKIVF